VDQDKNGRRRNVRRRRRRRNVRRRRRDFCITVRQIWNSIMCKRATHGGILKTVFPLRRAM
jgi:hypothetical protein